MTDDEQLRGRTPLQTRLIEALQEKAGIPFQPAEQPEEERPHAISGQKERHDDADEVLAFAIKTAAAAKLVAQLDRIEDMGIAILEHLRQSLEVQTKLLAALEEDEDEQPQATLDGVVVGGPRDVSQSLG
jgi:hypothetical protein